jgi:hypothetical protein
VVEDANKDAQDIARRHESKELEAVDVTRCVSVDFVNAVTDDV